MRVSLQHNSICRRGVIHRKVSPPLKLRHDSSISQTPRTVNWRVNDVACPESVHQCSCSIRLQRMSHTFLFHTRAALTRHRYSLSVFVQSHRWTSITDVAQRASSSEVSSTLQILHTSPPQKASLLCFIDRSNPVLLPAVRDNWCTCWFAAFLAC